ncbi:dihydrofolate reductase [Lactococcus allomyrinae]|uniref:Dihydrofolate reductase n=1 Tax=Lactococcus allomyrinae TaxID=2419773 RepID=A0A387BGR5_9LACT|nr:dihydrofolate reductase [Lactococcus allomyrinae]AYG00326.1 dihydrofolate reductase [Lactococcus allomyrinae]
MIIGIWAEDEHGLIGKEEKMPWHLPAEQQHFKETTMGQVILMGRKTFDGMKKRALPGRISIVLTRDKNYVSENPNVIIMNSKEDVLKWYKAQNKSLFITGGAEILKLFESDLEQIYRTIVQGVFEGDAYFPSSFDFSKFTEISKKMYEKDAKNPYDFIIKKYEKVN